MTRPHADGPWRSRLRVVLLIAGIWTLVALFTTQLQHFAIHRSGGTVAWRVLVWANLVSCWVWAAFTPLILALGRRFRIDRRRWITSIALHLCVGILLTVIDLVVLDAAAPWINPFRTAPTIPLYVNVARQLFPYLSSYFVIVALAHVAYYSTRSRDEALRAARLEAQLNAARLHSLQLQLHPHFLFNTLNTIAEQLYADPAGADAMITRLSRLLRSSFAEPERQEVTLREELEVLQYYLDIARVRFGDRLTVHVDIHPNALEALVPRLILQPIVENALRHGIEMAPTPGRLEIKARMLPETLVLEVRDNGVGIPDSGPREGTGLRNTRDRLRHHFGAQQQLHIGRVSGGGTVVRITIPFISGPRANGNAATALRLARGGAMSRSTR